MEKMHFKSFEEYYKFNRGVKPREPEEYKPKKKKKKKEEPKEENA